MIIPPGGIGDLVARAQGRPIYCTAPSFVRHSLRALTVDLFRREFPDAEFIDARTLYRHSSDRWRRCWPRDHDRYGGAIVVTLAEDCPAGTDRFAGITGKHEISVWVALEIMDLMRLGRPVAWHAVVFPATYWVSRFTIEQFEWVSTSRWARLVPTADAEIFRPTIDAWL